MVRRLQAAGLDINKGNRLGHTVLFYTSRNSFPETQAMFVDLGCVVDFDGLRQYAWTASPCPYSAPGPHETRRPPLR